LDEVRLDIDTRNFSERIESLSQGVNSVRIPAVDTNFGVSNTPIIKPPVLHSILRLPSSWLRKLTGIHRLCVW